MTSKKHFRITLFAQYANSLCETLVCMAAKGNGGTPLTLEQLKTVAEGNILQYPTLNEGITAELIGDKLLHIDRKVGEEYQTALIVEEADMYELQDEEDIPEGVFNIN